MMEREQYINRYVGPINERRTHAYNMNGINTDKFTVVDTPYKSLYKIVRKDSYGDISGFIYNDKIHCKKCVKSQSKSI